MIFNGEFYFFGFVINVVIWVMLVCSVNIIKLFIIWINLLWCIVCYGLMGVLRLSWLILFCLVWICRICCFIFWIDLEYLFSLWWLWMFSWCWNFFVFFFMRLRMFLFEIWEFIWKRWLNMVLGLCIECVICLCLY